VPTSLERLGDRMTAEDHETSTTAMGLVTTWLLAERDRFALLHGDYRLDNLLVDPDQSWVSVVDWQTLDVGLPARDLAYFTATNLDSQLRLAIVKDLVDEYHRALSGYGLPAMTVKHVGATTGSG
jgi:aminoglycoside phosphotransferase (APT) family kinase protein